MSQGQILGGVGPANPRLVVLIGPPAVGKMTVGQELSALIGWPLIFNHQILDLVTRYFAYGTDSAKRLLDGFNGAFFREAAAAGISLIATWGWRFDLESDSAHIWSYVEPYLTPTDSVSFVELTAPLEARLARNRTENRERHKNVERATDEELSSLPNRWNSNGAFPFDLPHMILDNTNIDPSQAARAIATHFALPILTRPT